MVHWEGRSFKATNISVVPKKLHTNLKTRVFSFFFFFSSAIAESTGFVVVLRLITRSQLLQDSCRLHSLLRELWPSWSIRLLVPHYVKAKVKRSCDHYWRSIDRAHHHQVRETRWSEQTEVLTSEFIDLTTAERGVRWSPIVLEPGIPSLLQVVFRSRGHRIVLDMPISATSTGQCHTQYWPK